LANHTEEGNLANLEKWLWFLMQKLLFGAMGFEVRSMFVLSVYAASLEGIKYISS
jgi:hypothetical protein